MLCKIGEIEVWRLLEINAPYLTPEELFPTAGNDVRAMIEAEVPGGVCPTTGGLILPIQGFLLKTPSHNILVDSCVGNHKTVPGTPNWHMRSDTRFVAALTAAGIGFDDVDYVLCTHLHADHVGWNTQLLDGRWVPTFPNARYLMPEADEDLQRSNNSHLYLESVLPVIEAGQAELVVAEHRLGDQVSLVPTPGHTPGHVSIALQSGEARAMITGDAIHTTAQCRYPGWHFKWDADSAQAVISRHKLLEDVSEAGCIVLGSHFALPSIGRVRQTAEAFRWEGAAG